MPPSGFNQNAINGLLGFVQSTYESTLSRFRDKDLSEISHLQSSIVYLDNLIEKTAVLSLDGTVTREGIMGLKQFVTENYKDLIAEIYQGKKNEGIAVQTELDHIKGYLSSFKI